MKYFYRLKDALPELFKEPYHPELTKEILFALYCVEQLVSGGEADSFVTVTETEADIRAVEKAYALNELTPETEEHITAGEEVWLKRVYIRDDTGNGYVIFQRTQNGSEKRTE